MKIMIFVEERRKAGTDDVQDGGVAWILEPGGGQ